MADRRSDPIPAPGRRTLPRICPLCEACCGLDLTLDGAGPSARVVAVRGRDADVFSRGYLCPKAVALKDLHEDPDRVRTPLVKRNGRLEPAGWDEAFAEIERRLPPIRQQHGGDAVALAVGNPVAHKMGLLLYVPRLARALGTRNIFSASTLDQMPKQLSSGLMFGDWLSIPVPDIERTQWMLVLGANPAVSNGSLWTVPDFRGKAKALRARGGRLVVVDPRRTETAELADEHHFIRPGTDVLLLLGIAHALFDEGRVQPGRLAPHLAGLDEVAAAVRPFAPERVGAACGIDAATIRSLARALATTERAVVYGRLGTCASEFGTLASWLVDVLNALTGHLDAPGGAMFPQAPAFAANTLGAPGRGRGIVTGRHRSRVSAAPEVFGELPMTCLAEEIETAGAGRVRALLTVASNPVLSAPGGGAQGRIARALDALDFMVSLDLYVNETTRHADVILPAASPLADMHYDVAFAQLAYRNVARASRALLPHAPGAPAEWEILLRLTAIARGLGPQADLARLDDELTAAELQRAAGAHAPALLRAVGDRRGPERLLDLALRGGPYGAAAGGRAGLPPGGLTLQALLDAPDGIDLGPLAPRIPELLRTPSGRVELAPPALLADLARVPALLEAGPGAADAHLLLIGRRQVRSNNSWMHNLPVLAKGRDRCTLQLHPQDARRLGLADGQRARIVRTGGAAPAAVDATVEVSEAMMPGVASLPHGWGHGLPGAQLNVAAAHPGANLNAVLDDARRDPLSGNAVLNGVPVQVRPAE